MTTFEIRQLEYFTMAVKTGSFSKASKKLFISQQALSKGIGALENSLGVTLFTRTTSGVVLTECGMVFFKHAQDALKLIAECKRCAKNYRQDIPECVRMAIASFCFDDKGGTLSAQSLASLQHQCKDVDYTFEDMPVEMVGQKIADRVFDLGIAPIEDITHTFDATELASYHIAVVMSKNNSFSRQSFISISQLIQGKVVLPHHRCQGENYLCSLYKRITTQFNCAAIQIDYADASRLINDETIFVIRPMQHALRTTNSSKVKILPLVNEKGEPAVVPLYLFWRRDKYLSAGTKHAIKFISGIYRKTH